MTDRARELLERVLIQFGKWHMQAEYDWDSEYALKEEIRAYLAQPEVKREALSDEYLKIHIWQKSLDYRFGFVNGVRFAEKHHGIGGGE